MDTTPQKLLRVRDVAKICRVSPGAVRRWIAAGKLPSVQTPGAGRLLVDPDALAVAMRREHGEGR